MRKSINRLPIAALFAVLVSPLHAAVAPEGGALDSAGVRQQLSSYFANIAKNSPTVLGGLAKSPETMNAVQARISSMSDQELAGFQKLMSEAPDWKIAPEAFAAGLPPKMLEQIRRVGADTAAEVPEGQEMRDDVRTLAKVLNLLPDAKLKELGIDRQIVASLEATFAEMSPLQAAMLHQQAGSTSWDARSAAAIHALPPVLQRGAAALAAHGSLTETDVADLQKFRAELEGLLGRIDKLPPETRKNLKVEQLRPQMQQLGLASPDLLFMVRHNVPPPMMKTLQENVSFLERIANLSDKEKEELEKFRKDLNALFQPFEQAKSTAEGASSAKQMIAGLGPEHLLLLKQGMDRFGNWQSTLPVLYQTLASPDLPVRLERLRGTPDPQVVQSLETFRQQTLAYVETVATTPGLDVKLLDGARRSVRTASLSRLEVMRTALQSMPQAATAEGRLSIVALYDFSCQIDLPDPLPNIDLNFICNPIETALTAIETAITSTVNTIVSGVQSALQASINGINSLLTSAVNLATTAVNTITSTVNSIISAITTTVTNILSFIQTIPTLAYNAIKAALDLLLDIQIGNGVTLRNLIAQGVQQGLTSMKTLLGLSAGWWTALSTFTLPAIPCPPAGFHTPWGDVGDGAASDNFGRYKLLMDGIIGLIPNTELSLSVKIPAQVLYLGYEFLGVCLEQATATADAATLTSRHTLVLANFSNLQTYIGDQIDALADSSSDQTTVILTLVSSQSTTIQNKLQIESSAIQTLLSNKSTDIQNLLNSESTEIQSLLQNESDDTQEDLDAFQKLDVRLIIERVLKAGLGHEVALFQLLEPRGHLRLVSEIVKETIDVMVAAQQAIGQAQMFFDRGLASMNAGKEKEAFKFFGLAYGEATK